MKIEYRDTQNEEKLNPNFEIFTRPAKLVHECREFHKILMIFIVLLLSGARQNENRRASKIQCVKNHCQALAYFYESQKLYSAVDFKLRKFVSKTKKSRSDDCYPCKNATNSMMNYSLKPL